MTELFILVGKLVTPTTVLERISLKVRDGLIVDVVEGYVESSNVLNYRDYTVVPGMLDTHIHGLRGFDVNDGKPESILSMAKHLVEYGVTGFQPSSVTAPHEELLKICRAVREAYEAWRSGGEPAGARILGLHLEGPYINPDKRGAQNPDYIRRPSRKEVEEYISASNNLLRMMTIAPEVEGGLSIIPYLVERGIVVSVGHSNADYDTAIKAIARGATRATHLFNAMRRVHHRDPGLVVALMESPRVYVELIVDFVHLHPAMIRFTVSHVGKERVVLVSDAISAAGLEDGVYSLGGLEVRVENGVARLRDGTLAGSTLTMDKALRNMVSLGYDLRDVTWMTSLNPAQSLRLARLGDLRPGYYADLVVLDDELNVRATVVEGVEVYSRSA